MTTVLLVRIEHDEELTPAKVEELIEDRLTEFHIEGTNSIVVEPQ